VLPQYTFSASTHTQPVLNYEFVNSLPHRCNLLELVIAQELSVWKAYVLWSCWTFLMSVYGCLTAKLNLVTVIAIVSVMCCYLRQRRRYMLFSVCLSVCLSVSLARLLKDTCMDLDEMLHDVGTWMKWSTFESDTDHSSDPVTGLLSLISHKLRNFAALPRLPANCAATRNFTLGKSHVYVLAARR